MILEKFYKTNKEPLTINYDNVNLTYCGRWNNNGTGMQSGWLGSYVKFKVRNTSFINTSHFIEITNTTASAFASFYIDQNPNRVAQYTLQGSGATFTGTKTVSLPIINDGQWHEIKIYSYAGLIADQFNQTCKNTLVKLEMASGAQIDTSTIGDKIIQCVGDSWMGAAVNWTRCIDNASYEVYPVSANGLKASETDTFYNFNYNTITNTTDPNCDAVLVSFGVNDFNAGVSGAAFQTSLLSLVDKIRAKQATAKIFLIRVPSNTGASKDFGQYGTNMSTIAGLRSNVVYLDTTSLDASTSWDTDTFHLSANSVLDFSAWVKTQLLANGI